MDSDQQRDFAEEAYWRAFCPECGTSPCAVDGEHYSDPVPDEIAEQAWQDAVEAFHGVGPYAMPECDGPPPF